MPLDRIEDAIDDIAAGRPIIVVDDEDRENEGDLVMAASKTTTETMAFVIKAGGLVCVPVTRAEAERLNLNPMASNNNAPLATAFTVSVDYREGLTTGISATERTATVRALSNPNVGAEDFVRPGHIFPLVAKDGGVLMRSGHTEAAVDLARLAGCPPTGLICEILGDDGETLKGDGLRAYAAEHDLKIVSIADLIAYRQRTERLVERVADYTKNTEIGTARAVVYSTPFDAAYHVALIFGEPDLTAPVVTRLHRSSPLEDAFGGPNRSLGKALDKIKAAGSGIVVYLSEGAEGVMPAEPAWADGEGGASAAARMESWRDVGLGAQILRDLGVRRIRLVTSRERQYVGLSGFGIEIDGTELTA